MQYCEVQIPDLEAEEEKKATALERTFTSASTTASEKPKKRLKKTSQISFIHMQAVMEMGVCDPTCYHFSPHHSLDKHGPRICIFFCWSSPWTPIKCVLPVWQIILTSGASYLGQVLLEQADGRRIYNILWQIVVWFPHRKNGCIEQATLQFNF